MKQKLWMALAVSAGLIFSAQTVVLADSTEQAQSSEQQSGGGQVLPISQQVEIGGRTIYLEVPQTPEQKATGLMYRTSLPDNRGMLFVFEPPQPTSFWMKNVPINLDIIFIRDQKVVGIAANVPPCPTEPCPVYFPTVDTAQGTQGVSTIVPGQSAKLPENIKPVLVDRVIEVRGGLSNELGLQVGDDVYISNYLNNLKLH